LGKKKVKKELNTVGAAGRGAEQETGGITINPEGGGLFHKIA